MEKIPSLGSVHFLLSEKSIFEFYIFSMKTSNLCNQDVRCLRFFYWKNPTFLSVIFFYGTKFHPRVLTIFFYRKNRFLGFSDFFLSEKNPSLDLVGFHSSGFRIFCLKCIDLRHLSKVLFVRNKILSLGSENFLSEKIPILKSLIFFYCKKSYLWILGFSCRKSYRNPWILVYLSIEKIPSLGS